MKLYPLALVFSWFLLFAVSKAPGRIEGWIYPVIEDFQYSLVEENIVFGSFHKVRNCSFEELNWYIVDRNSGNRSRITINFLDSEVIRLKGLEFFGPWQVRTRPDQLQNSEVYVRHSCHNLWYTYTRLI